MFKFVWKINWLRKIPNWKDFFSHNLDGNAKPSKQIRNRFLHIETKFKYRRRTVDNNLSLYILYSISMCIVSYDRFDFDFFLRFFGLIPNLFSIDLLHAHSWFHSWGTQRETKLNITSQISTNIAIELIYFCKELRVLYCSVNKTCA